MCHILKVKNNRPHGFTLIEVMLAMAVFAIAGVALVGAASSSARNLTYHETKVLAYWVANNQLVEASLQSQWPPQNNKKGKLELAGREWFWVQKVLKTEDNSMRAITIEVRAQEDAEHSLVDLMTYLSAPN